MDDIKTLTGHTSTWTPPTKEECQKHIIDYSVRYANKKWYEDKSYVLKQIKYWARELDEINGF